MEVSLQRKRLGKTMEVRGRVDVASDKKSGSRSRKESGSGGRKNMRSVDIERKWTGVRKEVEVETQRMWRSTDRGDVCREESGSGFAKNAGGKDIEVWRASGSREDWPDGRSMRSCCDFRIRLVSRG